jgi:hypothetical protein
MQCKHVRGAASGSVVPTSCLNERVARLKNDESGHELDGARDLHYDSARQLVLVQSEGHNVGTGGLSIWNVSSATPSLLSSIGLGTECPGCSGHGMAYDPEAKRAFM